MEKINSGIRVDRDRFSEAARRVFEIAVDHRRQLLLLPDNAMRGSIFKSNQSIIIRLESRFTEEDFMACPGICIDAALIDAAQLDYWYLHEKRYDDEHAEYQETEIADEGNDE